MGIIKDSIIVIKRRPLTIILPGIVMLAISVLDYYNPIYDIIYSFGMISGKSIFENFIYIMQLLCKPVIIMKVVPIVIACLILLSIVAAMILSVYLNVLNNAVYGREKFRGEIIYSIKRSFAKIWIMTLTGLLLFIFLLVFMLISSVPAMIITRTFVEGKSELLFPMLFIDLLTVYALFFAFMFFRIYLFYWFPAALNYTSKPFAAAKRIADKNFWKITGKFVTFDVIFLIFEILLVIFRTAVRWSESFSLQIIFLISNWLFYMFFATTFATYIISSFKNFKQMEYEL